MLDKFLERITLGGIFFIPIVPLIVTNFLFFPYISGKNFFFRIVVEIIFAAWVILALRDPQYRPKKSALLIATTLFVIFMAMSAIFGESPSKSFWSNFERMEGVVGYLHVFMFMFVAACSLTKERFRTFFHINLGVATVVACYGVLQHLGIFLISQNEIRVDATLGNPIYMAAYMLMCFFIAAYFLLEKNPDQNYKLAKYSLLASINVTAIYLLFILSRVADGKNFVIFLFVFLAIVIDILFFALQKKLEAIKAKVLSVIYVALGILFAYALYLTQTRGAVLGLLAGLIFTCIALAIFDKGRSRKIAISSLVLIVILFGAFMSLRQQPFIQNNPTLGRLARISLSDTTTASRITIWGLALDGFKEHPIIGWGNENFNLLYNKYYEPKLITSEQWFDRSHNILVDWLVTTGVIGLGLYLSLYCIAGFYLFRRNSKFTVKEKAVIAGLLVAYLVQNLFVFDNISGIMLFAAILAYVYVRNSYGALPTKHEVNPQMLNLAAVVTLLALLFSIYYVNVKPIRVAFALNQGTILSVNRKHQEALDTYKKVFAMNTFGSREGREHLMLASQRALGDSATPVEVNQAFLDETAMQMQTQIKDFPGDLRNYVLLGSYLKTYGLYDQALIFLEEAKKLSPKKQAVYQILADMYLAQGKPVEAIREAKFAYDLYPQSVESAKILAMVYFVAQEETLAEEVLVKQFNSIYVYDPRLVNIYKAAKDFDRVIGVWEKYKLDNPKDLLGYMSLYDLFTELGNSEEARKNLVAAIAIREDMVADDPKNVDKIIALYDLYIKNNDLPRAKAAIESAVAVTEDYLKKHDDDARAHLSLASFYMVLGRKEDAISILQKALRIKNSPRDEINYYIQTIAAGKNPWMK